MYRVWSSINEMKYLWLFKQDGVKGPQRSVCMILRVSELLFATLVDMLVCLPFMQSTQVPKSAKSSVCNTPSFTNLVILSLEMCPNLLCHNIEELSLIIQRFMPISSCKVKRLFLNPRMQNQFIQTIPWKTMSNNCVIFQNTNFVTCKIKTKTKRNKFCNRN